MQVQFPFFFVGRTLPGPVIPYIGRNEPHPRSAMRQKPRLQALHNSFGGWIHTAFGLIPMIFLRVFTIDHEY
jgi:hypothetical protein